MDGASASPGFSVTSPDIPLSPWLRFARRWQAPVDHRPGRPQLRRIADWQIFHQLRRRSRIIVGEGHVVLEPGHAALIPPGLIYAWLGDSGSLHLAVHGDLHAQPQLRAPDMVTYLGREAEAGPALSQWTWRWRCAERERRLGLVVDCRSLPAWVSRLERLIEPSPIGSSIEPTASLAAQSHYGAVMADLLVQAARIDATGADERALSAILAAAARAPVGAIDVAAMAAEAGLGETRFRQRVAQLCGAPPRAAVERLRMERAAYALRMGPDSISAVAAAVGYEDPYHFSRVFKRVFGCSPRRWRQDAGADS